MKGKVKNWLVGITAGLSLGFFCAAWTPYIHLARAQTSSDLKCLYGETPVKCVSQLYPATDPYFAKPESIALGDVSLGNAGTYYNDVQVLVQADGFYSEIEYDISGYDYDFFTVTVGNRSGTDDFTNEILYRVYGDEALLAQTSHPLVAYEIERLACKIPIGTQTLRLRGESAVNNPAFGECNWVNPSLTYFTETESTESLKDVPVSGNNAETGQEEYAIKSATLNDGKGGTITDENAITGAIHGDYGNNTWKFSADYDISGGNYNRLTMDVGMLFNETQNTVIFSVKAIGGTNGMLAGSPAMDGTTYHHFDVYLPAGTTKIQIWAQSQSNMKACGNLAICNAKLYSGEKIAPVLYGAVTSAVSELAFGDPLPALRGEFRLGGATVAGTVSLDEGQTVQAGEHEYGWTFNANNAECYETVTGRITLNAARGNGYIAPSFSKTDFVPERGPADAVFPLLTMPAEIELSYGGSPVSQTAYMLDHENQTLILKGEYLESLDAGEHIFTATCENGDFTVTVNVKTIEEVQPEILCLYNEEYTSITSQHYPADAEYFAKVPSITLGNGMNRADYANVLQVLVAGPFSDQKPELGTYFSALTYDISDYRYEYFSVTVGNANCATDESGAVTFTNKILYKVMIDGVTAVQSSHALSSFETEVLTCQIPAGAREIRLHAQSESGTSYGECNWANPVLSGYDVGTVTERALTEMPVSGNSTETGQEEYAIKSATLNDGKGGTITDENAITGAIHGDYGNNTWKFSADYDISGGNYNRLTMDVGMLFNETQNTVIFSVKAIGGTNGTLAESPAMDGTTYHHFDVYLPAGTTKIQIWAQSQSNMKAYGNLAICNAKLYSGGKITPELLGEIVSAQEKLTWGTELPALSGNITVGKATIQGTLALDAGQTIEIGTHTYTWTFTPNDSKLFAPLTGEITLTAGKRTVDMGGVAFESKSFVYDGTEHMLAISGLLPEFVTVSYDGNARTAVGTSEVIAIFVLDADHENLYEAIPSLVAELTVTSGTFADSKLTADFTLGSGEDVTFELKLDAVNASIAYKGESVSSEYAVINEKRVTVSAEYLNTLEAGQYVFTVSSDGGEFEFTVNVLAKSGLNGLAIGLIVGGVVLVAGVSVGTAVFVLRKRKQK